MMTPVRSGRDRIPRRRLSWLPQGATDAAGSFGGAADNTIRLWELNSGAETAKLETDDVPINCITALPAARLVAGDAIGRLHWLEIVD
jgi:WD40 repeat protein